MEKALDVFARWFTSVSGSFQTLAIVAAWVVLELVYPQMDPHGFLVLYVLTVYSAITQPILAYVARKSGEETEEQLDEIQDELEEELHPSGRACARVCPDCNCNPVCPKS